MHGLNFWKNCYTITLLSAVSFFCYKYNFRKKGDLRYDIALEKKTVIEWIMFLTKSRRIILDIKSNFTKSFAGNICTASLVECFTEAD